MDVQDFLAKRKEYINYELDRAVPGEDQKPLSLYRAMRHSLFAGGKRLRPILLLEACRLAGGSVDKALKPALGIECLHTFTLIHDDLPCMDDDDFRRGVPTCHRVYGEDIAVLAGDALVFMGMSFMAGKPDETADPVRLRIVRLANEALGPAGVIGGQVMDLEAEKETPRPSCLKEIHAMKTASLLVLALEIGGILGGMDEQRLQELKNYGYHLGMAFQITDDILDVTGEIEVLGKSPGKDSASGKMTYPALMGMKSSRNEARRQVELACRELQMFSPESRVFFEELAYFLLERVE